MPEVAMAKEAAAQLAASKHDLSGKEGSEWGSALQLERPVVISKKMLTRCGEGGKRKIGKEN